MDWPTPKSGSAAGKAAGAGAADKACEPFAPVPSKDAERRGKLWFRELARL